MRRYLSVLGCGSVVFFLSVCVRANPGALNRIELEEIRTTFGEESTVRIQRWHYSQGEFGGDLWIVRIPPHRQPGDYDVDHEEALGAAVEVRNCRLWPQPLAECLAGSLVRVAVNGGFYDDDGPMGLVRARGTTVVGTSPRGGSGLLLLGHGRRQIVHRDEAVLLSGFPHGLQSIDRLASEGRLLIKNKPGLAHDARTVAALDDAGVLYLIVVYDQRAVGEESATAVVLNRDSSHTGPTLYDIAEFLLRSPAQGGLGVRWVLNLDGGWSTSLHARLGGRSFDVVAYGATVNAVLVAGG